MRGVTESSWSKGWGSHEPGEDRSLANMAPTETKQRDMANLPSPRKTHMQQIGQAPHDSADTALVYGQTWPNYHASTSWGIGADRPPNLLGNDQPPSAAAAHMLSHPPGTVVAVADVYPRMPPHQYPPHYFTLPQNAVTEHQSTTVAHGAFDPGAAPSGHCGVSPYQYPPQPLGEPQDTMTGHEHSSKAAQKKATRERYLLRVAENFVNRAGLDIDRTLLLPKKDGEYIVRRARDFQTTPRALMRSAAPQAQLTVNQIARELKEKIAARKPEGLRHKYAPELQGQGSPARGDPPVAQRQAVPVQGTVSQPSGTGGRLSSDPPANNEHGTSAAGERAPGNTNTMRKLSDADMLRPGIWHKWLKAMKD